MPESMSAFARFRRWVALKRNYLRNEIGFALGLIGLERKVKPDPYLSALYGAFRDDDIEKLREVHAVKPLTTFYDLEERYHLLAEAMKDSVGLALLKELIALGVDPTAIGYRHELTPLQRALQMGRVDYVDFLLAHGVDPSRENNDDHRRITLCAMNLDHPPELQMKLLERLITAGVDLNVEYTMFGDQAQRFTALDHAQSDDVRAFLQSHGAKPSTQLVTDRNAALRKALED